MNITLIRDRLTDQATTGLLLIDDFFYCYTLEDVVREIKIPGKTAIPAGRYPIIISRSNRFKRDLPLLLDVPNFEGIRIHPGNTAADTEGCILVGVSRGRDTVIKSREAFDKLFALIQAAAGRKESMQIEIRQLK